MVMVGCDGGGDGRWGVMVVVVVGGCGGWVVVVVGVIVGDGGGGCGWCVMGGGWG